MNQVEVKIYMTGITMKWSLIDAV